MQFSKSIVFAAVALFAPLAMHADSISGPSSISLAGLSFGNFSCSLMYNSAAVFPSTCSQISVSSITAPGNGIEFQSGFIATPGTFDDAKLSYTVSSTAPITSVGLDFNGYFEGLGVSSVSETIFNGSTLVGNVTVFCAQGVCAPSDEAKTITLNGSYTNLLVKKDILVAGLAPSSYAGISLVDQTFTTSAATPEPAALGLIGAGLLAAGAIRRRAVKA